MLHCGFTIFVLHHISLSWYTLLWRCVIVLSVAVDCSQLVTFALRPSCIRCRQNVRNMLWAVFTCAGAGKSLTFQFPPFTREHAFTVVVCPLIALLKEQVEKCQELGLDAMVGDFLEYHQFPWIMILNWIV